jgi:hypothetical protein
MGFIKEWAQQAAGQPPTNWEPTIYYPANAIVSGVTPRTYDTGGSEWVEPDWDDYKDFFGLDVGGTFTIAEEIYSLREDNGQNVFAGVAAYNPDDLIEQVERAVRDFRYAVEDLAPPTLVPQTVTLAKEQADLLLGDDKTDAAIAAYEARARTEHLESISRTLAGLFEGGAILTTQTYADLAILEDGFQRTLADFSARLRMGREDQRARLASEIMSSSLQGHQQRAALQQVYSAVAMDALKFIVSAKQDQIDKDVEYLTNEKFWNYNLLAMALNANSGNYGAQIPRAQTKGERLLAAITGSVGMGVQGGTAMGNPQAGLAMGGLNFLGQALLM